MSPETPLLGDEVPLAFEPSEQKPTGPFPTHTVQEGFVPVMVARSVAQPSGNPPTSSPPPGGFVPRVYLVGAGPGDPELLTLRAARLIAQAQVLVYDALVSPDVLALAPTNGERYYVGKRVGRHSLAQEEINTLLVRLWQQAPRVIVRLKGGDPTVFGRLGEELTALRAAGVPFEVIPGVTAATAAAARFGFSLTERGLAQSCALVTGHERADGTLELDWDTLARRNQTLVFYMGLTTLPRLCEALIAHGRAPDTPAAIIERVSCPHERLITGTLQALPAIARDANVQPPALVVVGEVLRSIEQHPAPVGTTYSQAARWRSSPGSIEEHPAPVGTTPSALLLENENSRPISRQPSP